MPGGKKRVSENRPVEVLAPPPPVAPRTNLVGVPASPDAGANTASVGARDRGGNGSDTSTYALYLVERRKFFERAFELLRQYISETPSHLIDREFLETALRALEDELPFDPHPTVSDVAAWSGQDVLSDICKFIEFSRQSIVPEPAAQGLTEPWKLLTDILGRSLADVFTALRAEGEEAVALRDLFAKEGYPLASQVSSERVVPYQEPLPLPTVAPKLWANRDPGEKAPAFLQKHYASWIEAGVLTGSAVKRLDPLLYNAYHVRVSRKPEEAVPLVEGKPQHFIDDPQEAIERVRASARESYHRRKGTAPRPD